MTDRGLKTDEIGPATLALWALWREGYAPVQVTTEEYEQAYHELFAPEVLPCDDHEAIDNGTKTSECRHCRQRMVFDFPEWRVSK